MGNGDEKRLMLALAIAMLVLIGYPYLYDQFFPQPLQAPYQASEETTGLPAERTGKTLTEAAVSVPGEAPAPAAPSGVLTAEASAIAPPLEGLIETLTKVETPLFIAVFTSIGGGVKSFKLKHYRLTIDEDAEPLDIASEVAGSTPFQTRINMPGLPGQPAFVNFTPSKESLFVGENDSSDLVYTYSAPSGLTVKKKYTITGTRYALKTTITVTNSSGAPQKGLTTTDIVSLYELDDYAYYHQGPLRMVKDEVERQDLEPSEESGKSALKWLGLEDKYFLLSFIPDEEKLVHWSSVVPSVNTARVSLGLPFELTHGGSTSFGYTAYIGPKEYDRLVAAEPDLVEAIEFGFFSFMAKPFLVTLNFLERYVMNYGLAIIALTCIIKILFHPLTNYSMRSMKAMQKINPQMVALKEKYKDDKNRMNKELMGLYKRYKVNPLSGCLPMILQLPVFIALYEVFYVAIELRHAPFFLWILDLSAKDPYYVTPVLMGISMFIQQKLTPTAMDPMQAKMMLFLPIILTYVFLSFPAGLVIYWLVNNVLSIIQQQKIHKEGSSPGGGGGGGGTGKMKKAKEAEPKAKEPEPASA